MPTPLPSGIDKVPARYTEALGDRDPLSSLRKAPRRLKKLLKGVSKKRLRARPEPGKWSVHEVIAHLADGEVVLGARLRFIAAMDRPTIVGYDQDAFVERLAIDGVSTKQLWEDFQAARALNVRLLERLPPTALARVGVHSERGEETLGAMIVMHAGHDRIHEQQIAAALERKPARGSRGTEEPAPTRLRKSPHAL